MICEEIQMRFKKYKNLLINPPSNVIHLSNLEKETCTEDQIRKFLAGIGHIEKMKYEKRKTKKPYINIFTYILYEK